MAKFSPLVYRKFHNISYAQENWLLGDHWTGRRGSYQAVIEAKSKSADKKKLAKFITGNSNDWTLLGGNNKVALGEKINVSPLLAKFETKLREKIASICQQEQLNSSFQPLTTKFTKDDGTVVEDALIGSVEVSTKGESAGINRFFTKKTQGSIDCIRAVKLIYAKAVLEIIGKDAFDGVGFTEDIQPDEFAGLKKQPMSNMLNGDRGWIRNYPDYLAKYEGGAWQAENVIRINNDLYWGFGDPPPKSETGWKNRLREIYNQSLKPEERRNEPVPGFDGEIIFIDVAYVAEVVFSYNITDK
jgi:hypothetical protein